MGLDKLSFRTDENKLYISLNDQEYADSFEVLNLSWSISRVFLKMFDLAREVDIGGKKFYVTTKSFQKFCRKNIDNPDICAYKVIQIVAEAKLIPEQKQRTSEQKREPPIFYLPSPTPSPLPAQALAQTSHPDKEFGEEEFVDIEEEFDENELENYVDCEEFKEEKDDRVTAPSPTPLEPTPVADQETWKLFTEDLNKYLGNEISESLLKYHLNGRISSTYDATSGEFTIQFPEKEPERYAVGDIKIPTTVKGKVTKGNITFEPKQSITFIPSVGPSADINAFEIQKNNMVKIRTNIWLLSYSLSLKYFIRLLEPP